MAHGETMTEFVVLCDDCFPPGVKDSQYISTNCQVRCEICKKAISPGIKHRLLDRKIIIDLWNRLVIMGEE